MLQGDATPSFQLSLPRVEARGHRRIRRLHPTGVEDPPEPSKDFSAQCKLLQITPSIPSMLSLDFQSLRQNITPGVNFINKFWRLKRQFFWCLNAKIFIFYL